MSWKILVIGHNVVIWNLQTYNYQSLVRKSSEYTIDLENNLWLQIHVGKKSWIIRTNIFLKCLTALKHEVPSSSRGYGVCGQLPPLWKVGEGQINIFAPQLFWQTFKKKLNFQHGSKTILSTWPSGRNLLFCLTILKTCPTPHAHFLILMISMIPSIWQVKSVKNNFHTCQAMYSSFIA